LDLDEEYNKELLKSKILSYLLMKSNLYYVGILATTILVLSGPASFATTTTDPTQLTETTTDQTEETSPEGTVTVAVAEGSNQTIQYYTYTPQTVEINAGESVTWFTPAEFPDIHTVTFVQDPNLRSDLILPFVPTAPTDFELLPPFNAGEPILIPTPDGTEAIVAVNKHVFYPTVLDANNETIYLEGTDIQATLNSTVKALNSGIILPQMPPTGAAEPNTTETGTTGEQLTGSEASITNETAITTNATGTATDVLTVPDEQGTSQGTEGPTGEETLGPPFPPVSSFTVTFEEPGIYPYFCAIHPWQTGQVVVRGDAPTETQPQPEPQAQTPTETQPQPEPQNQTETQGPGEQESPNPIFG
jgi:plastocyanin